MKRGNQLKDLLFNHRDQNIPQSEDLKQIIGNIPCPHNDITITSHSDYSDNTPQKYLQEVKPPLPPQDFYASGGYLESITPQCMNKIVDWSKQHITPGDSKNIFPQIIAPSIELSNENSLSLQYKNQDPDPKKILQSKFNTMRLEGKVWEKQKRHMESEIQQAKKQVRKLENENIVMQQKLEEQEEQIKLLQEKHKDYSCLEVLRGKYLEVAKQQMKTLIQQLEVKDSKMKDLNGQAKILIENERRMQEAIELELRELHAQLEIKDQMVKALKNQQNIEDNQTLLQYEEQLKEQSQQIKYFKEQNEEIMQENEKISDQIQIVLEKKAEQEQQIFEEYEKLRSTNFALLQENKLLKSQIEFQQKCEITRNKQSLIQAKQSEKKQTSQQTQLESEEKIMINQEIENIKAQFYTQIQELYKKLDIQDDQISDLTKELYSKKQQIDDLKQQQSISKQRKEEEIMENKEQKRQLKNYEQQLAELNEEKSKLLSKIQLLEQQIILNKKIDDDQSEKLNQQIKEKDKKNIDLYNQNRQMQSVQKELDDQISQMKDEAERQKKYIQLKNQEIKQLIEQNKQLQDKNQEVNQRLSILQQQMHQFESEIQRYEQSPQIPEKLRSQASVKSFEKTPHAVIELVEGFNQYQQEFYHLKMMFTEKLKAQEKNLLNLQQTNTIIIQQNQKLVQENNTLKDEIQLASQTKHQDQDDRGSAKTGDSLNIRTFVDQDHKKTAPIKSLEHHFSKLELVQPEIMSIEDTVTIFREILRRAVKSVEMIKMICPLPEIKELLMIILQVEEKLSQQSQITVNKKSRVITSILGANINIKMLDQQKKKSGSNCARIKQSHRNETGIIEFYE